MTDAKILPFDERLARIAEEALCGAIARGVKALISEPWRASRIVPFATNMDLSALAGAIAQRLPQCQDSNRRIGLLELRTAISMPEFRQAFIAYRERELLEA